MWLFITFSLYFLELIFIRELLQFGLSACNKEQLYCEYLEQVFYSQDTFPATGPVLSDH